MVHRGSICGIVMRSSSLLFQNILSAEGASQAVVCGFVLSVGRLRRTVLDNTTHTQQERATTGGEQTFT